VAYAILHDPPFSAWLIYHMNKTSADYWKEVLRKEAGVQV
jgi:hypothetical protein